VRKFPAVIEASFSKISALKVPLVVSKTTTGFEEMFADMFDVMVDEMLEDVELFAKGSSIDVQPKSRNEKNISDIVFRMLAMLIG